MGASTLLTASLAALVGAHAVRASHQHPVRPVIAKEPRAEFDGTFSVHQTRNPGYRPKSGLEAMIEVYNKYGVELTPQLKKAVGMNKQLSTSQKRQTVEAVPPRGLDYEFISPVQIGTPPQTMYLNFDTGSADLWVYSTDTNASAVSGQGLYKPALSTTAHIQSGFTFSIGYGDGSGAEGLVYLDRVEVAGFVVNYQAVESAETVSIEFTEDPYCWGFLGLGMSSGNTVKPMQQLTFMDNVKSSLASPLFTADLRSTIPGTYGFGFIGNSYTGRIQYAPVDRSAVWWLFAVTGYRIGPETIAGNPNSGYVTKPFRAIADTGTSLLLLSEDIVNAYWDKIPGSYYDDEWAAILFPCSATLPDFILGIGLYKGVVPGRYMNYGYINDTVCYGGLQSQGDIGFAIVGDTALKAQYAVFDLGNMRVGLANKPLQT
ncbi:endothiapepsin [Diaporthe helianthi]|uniref:Endothiapepsin n=1 Tax=Diaporthe helianthi TaxID=158607 RepID=A0A2P5I315_DIAHE|nr:endothiapepsin [Diaporthe helianthi]